MATVIDRHDVAAQQFRTNQAGEPRPRSAIDDDVGDVENADGRLVERRRSDGDPTDLDHFDLRNLRTDTGRAGRPDSSCPGEQPGGIRSDHVSRARIEHERLRRQTIDRCVNDDVPALQQEGNLDR